MEAGPVAYRPVLLLGLKCKCGSGVFTRALKSVDKEFNASKNHLPICSLVKYVAERIRMKLTVSANNNHGHPQVTARCPHCGRETVMSPLGTHDVAIGGSFICGQRACPNPRRAKLIRPPFAAISPRIKDSTRSLCARAMASGRGNSSVVRRGFINSSFSIAAF